MRCMALTSILILLASCGSFDQGPLQARPSRDRLFSVDELDRDFRQFRSILERRAVGLYADRARLTGLLDEIAPSLSRPLTEAEFYRILAPAVAALRCGHSFLSVSEAAEAHLRDEALFFPLDVRIIDRSLFVVADPHRTGVKPGSRILSIDGRPSMEIVDRITGVMSTDGRDAGRPRYDAERWFASMYYCLVDSPGRFELRVIPPGTDTASLVAVQAVRDPSRAKIARGIVHDTANAPYSSSLHERYALLRIPVFAYTRTRDYADYLEGFFAAVAEARVVTLVLDLRGNYGGTPVHTSELFKYLIDRPIAFFAKDNPIYLAPWKRPIRPSPLAFGGKLIVLMDEAAFSMNAFLLSLLRHHGIGTLVGAQSSGGHACSDASVDAVLRNTGLRVRYSTRVFSTAVEDQEPGIGLAPDIPVDWTIDGYLSGRDPVMEAALSILD